MNRFSPDRPGAAMSANLLGILLMLISAALFSSMAGMVRFLSADLHPLEIVFFRNLFGVLFFVPLLVRSGLAPLRTKRYGMLTLRGVLNGISMILFFMAVSLVPIAKVSALNFTTPLFVSLAAVLILGETMGPRRWMGLIIGFAGAMIILRPGLETINDGTMFALGSAAVWGSAILVIKSLSRTESSVTITIYGVLFLTPFTLIPALFVWTWPSLEQIAWMAVLGAAGTVGHLAFAKCMNQADASLVMPFDFTKLIWAALIGYLFFAEIPEIWTWIGGAVIFTSASYIAYRERASGLESPERVRHRP